MKKQSTFINGDRLRVVNPNRASDPDQKFRVGETVVVNYMEDGYVYLQDTPRDVKLGGWLPSRFELVEEQDMTKDYPTDLDVGDVLHSKTGREYTVASVDSDKVSYAYIPAGVRDNKISIDTRRYPQLHWVHHVNNKQGQRVWPKRQAQIGDRVDYNGKLWDVKGASDGVLRLERTKVEFVNRDSVEVV